MITLAMLATFTLLTLLCGVFYRLGGMGDDGRKRYPKVPRWVFDGKVRDIGCSLVGLGTLLLLGITAPWWAFVAYLGLSYGSLTTYNKWIGRLFGYPKDTVTNISWGMTGFTYGFTVFPLLFFGVGVLPFLIRCLTLAVTTALWSKYQGNATREEIGRGVLYNASMPLLLI